MTTTSYSLIIKGDVHEAHKAALQRGVRLMNVRTHKEVAIATADVMHADAIIAWFCEDGRAPFPPGTLLSYASISE